MIDADLACAIGTNRIFNIGILQNNQTSSSLGTQGIIIHMAVAHLTARLAIVSTHRRHGNTVFDCHALNGNRFKNFRVFALHDEILLLHCMKGIPVFVTLLS